MFTCMCQHFYPSFVLNYCLDNIMGKTCAAVNCTNRSEKSRGVSFHAFPNKVKDEAELKRYNAWVKQVQRTRAEWNGPTSSYTYVCSDHFTPDCYELRPLIMKEMGFSVNSIRKLKPNAVPTLFTRGKATKPNALKKQRTADDQRERERLLQDALCSNIASEVPVDCGTEDDNSITTRIMSVINNNEKICTDTSSAQAITQKKNDKVKGDVNCGRKTLKKPTVTESIAVQVDHYSWVVNGIFCNHIPLPYLLYRCGLQLGTDKTRAVWIWMIIVKQRPSPVYLSEAHPNMKL